MIHSEICFIEFPVRLQMSLSQPQGTVWAASIAQARKFFKVQIASIYRVDIQEQKRMAALDFQRPVFFESHKLGRIMELESFVLMCVGSWHRTWQSEGLPRGSCRLQDRHLEWTHGSVWVWEVRQGNFRSGRYPSRCASTKTTHLYSLKTLSHSLSKDAFPIARFSQEACTEPLVKLAHSFVLALVTETELDGVTQPSKRLGAHARLWLWRDCVM